MPPEDFAVPTTGSEAQAIVEGFQQPTTQAAPEQQAPATPAEFAINYKGKEEKYPLDKFTNLAQQGRDYNASMQQLKKDRDAWSAQVTQEKTKWSTLEQKLSQFQAVDDYIRKDPEWWTHVNDSYKQKVSGQVQGTNAPVDQLVKQLVAQELGDIKDFVKTAKEREIEQQRETENRVLDSKVSEYRTKYPDFDWTTVDEKGQDLETRILDHGIKMGLKDPETSFRLAANDFLHGQFVSRAAESAKGEVGDHLKKVNKLGLGPITEKRTLGLKPVANVRSKSWDQLTAEAIASANLTT